uniref:TPR-like protein n=1 Tax=Psilocybe cubensis TaxID=181762 RepID=A0A8H7XRF8_PSICU
MSSPKERHYWLQLRGALTAGQWRSEYPARAPNNTLLSWPELLRKFNKHCQGFKDISDVASQTQSLAFLLSARYKDDDENDDTLLDNPTAEGTERRDGTQRGSLALGTEGMLLEENIEEAMVGYEVLKSLESSKYDTIHLALAYYAYALGNPTECLNHLSKVPELLQFHNRIPNADSIRSNGSFLGPSSYAPSTTSFAGSFASVADIGSPEVRDGRGWAMAETFRSICLKGMSYEKLYPADPTMALKAYRVALPALSSLRSEFTSKSIPIPLSSSGKAEPALFTHLREMWRWVERLLWRAIILTSKTANVFAEDETQPTSTIADRASDSQNSLFDWFKHYTTCSSYWPPHFRTAHRTTIYALHLRALVLRHGVLMSLPAVGVAPVYAQPSKKSIPPSSSSKASSRPTTATSTPHEASDPSSTSVSLLTTQSSWMNTARSVAQDYRAVLSVSTSFPRAGERNFKVEEFVELCVKVWEAGGAIGEQASWVIEILNWAQRLTFNSSVILRHLTRLLFLGSSLYLAKRTLNLYIQVVGKAWEASKEGVGEDMDDDARWVETLVFGARMLCASVGGHGGGAFAGMLSGSSGRGQHMPIGDDGTEGIDEVLEARTILEKARTRLNENDHRLVAEVLLAEGIVWGLLGVKGQDPSTRPLNFDKAHLCLLHSIKSHPTPSAYYHLALSFARRIPAAGGLSDAPDSQSEPAPFPHTAYEHNLTQAIESAGHAVEGCPHDVRYWHLLGLLLSAAEKWSAAKEILERGAALDDTDSSDTVDQASESIGDESTSSPGEENMTNGGGGDADTVRQAETDSNTLKVPGANGVVNLTDLANASATNKTAKARNNGTSNGSAIHTSDSSAASLNGSAAISSLADLLPSHTLLLRPDETTLPTASSLLHPAVAALYPPSTSGAASLSVPSLSIDQYPPSMADLFEQHLQLRMTQVALMEVVEGPEGAEEGWLEIFSWVAEKRGLSGGSTPAASQPRQSLDQPRDSIDLAGPDSASAPYAHSSIQVQEDKSRHSAASKDLYPGLGVTTNPPDVNDAASDSLPVPIGITISPATPDAVPRIEDEVQLQLEKVEQAQLRVQSRRSFESFTDAVDERNAERFSGNKHREKEKERMKEKEKRQFNGFSIPKAKRSTSIERDTRGDTSKSKKVQQMLKGGVHKGRAGISAVSRRIGNGVGKNGTLRRSTSTPVLQPMSYQASSIHSRRRLSSVAHSGEHTPSESPPPPPPPSLPSSGTQQDFSIRNQRSARENRLLSDLWLMSAATFRRLGKIEQAKGSIQEAEVRDEHNPNVWVQLGLYYFALGLYQHAVDTLQKARFICSDDVGATVHLARLYLDPSINCKLHPTDAETPPSSPTSGSGSFTQGAPPSSTSASIDLAAGMLAHLTKGRGWDVPEAWYFLAKAYGMQGRKDKERETLKIALEFSEKRGVRDIGSALGWCL